MKPIIALHGVSKSYGRFKAVDDVSLAVGEGQFLTLLGSSGSGKTTTLRLIAGLETVDSGTIEFAGQDITDTGPAQRDLRMVFQDYALFPNLSVYDNVAFGLRLRIMRGRVTPAEIARRTRHYIELVQLADHQDKLPGQLSGGQKQRVALARALAAESPVVLFDEPLGSLDANLRRTMQVELKRLHRELGRTFIYVTHDQDEAMTMSDQVAVMQNARLLQIGTPEEIYLRPNSVAVARFIGGANIAHGTVERVAESTAHVRLRDGALVVAPVSGAVLAREQAVALMLRAEHFLLDRATAPADAAWLSGEVVEQLFLGRSIEYQVRLGESGETLSLIDNRHERATVARGARIEFAIQARHVRLLAA